MSETFICDECDERITSGYTVSWCHDLEDNAHGVAWDRTAKSRNLCPSCFPDGGLSFTDRVMQMLGLAN